jgi:hypothetical protein
LICAKENILNVAWDNPYIRDLESMPKLQTIGFQNVKYLATVMTSLLHHSSDTLERLSFHKVTVMARNMTDSFDLERALSELTNLKEFQWFESNLCKSGKYKHDFANNILELLSWNTNQLEILRLRGTGPWFVSYCGHHLHLPVGNILVRNPNLRTLELTACSLSQETAQTISDYLQAAAPGGGTLKEVSVTVGYEGAIDIVKCLSTYKGLLVLRLLVKEKFPIRPTDTALLNKAAQQLSCNAFLSGARDLV